MPDVQVQVTAVCESQAAAAKTAEVLLRATLGLAFDGIPVCLNVSPEIVDADVEAGDGD